MDEEQLDCIDIDIKELRDAPFRTNDPNNPDSNNGLITSIWGPHEWESFHCKTFGYPINPTEQQKKDYMQYFISLGNVLPCGLCRESYKQFITTGDPRAPNRNVTILNMDVMKSRETLTKWGMELHNAVNRKLGVDYGVTYEELCYKYESYRAKCPKDKKEKGCVMPLNMKARSYQKAETVRAPIIDVKYCKALENHAKKIGIDNYMKYIDYYSTLSRNSKEWSVRDCVCRKIIKHMRKNGISSIQNNMPSYPEMLLISMRSSTLDKNKLEEIIKQEQMI